MMMAHKGVREYCEWGHIIMKQNRQAGAHEHNLTEGVIWQQILIFFFPLLLGTFFQTLYNTVDAIVVGKFVGTTGLSAVGGAAASFINLMVGFFVGISSGATVVLAQLYGAGRAKEVERAVHTAVAIALAGGLVLTVVCLAVSRPVMVLMGTPADTMDGSLTYLYIYAFGMVANMVYNMGSGIMRAVGDSKRPTYYLIAGAAANIVLDLLFIAVFHWGVAGAAIATIISQFVSAILTLLHLMRVDDCYQVTLRQIRFDGWYLRKILAIGIPAGCRSCMYSLSNMVIQSAINGFGTERVAAWAVWGKIDSMYWMVLSSLGTATTTFVGQNYGAGKRDRVRKCVVQMAAIFVMVTVFFMVFIRTFDSELFSLFSNDPKVLSAGLVMVNYMIRWYMAYILIELLSAVLIGCGDALIPTLITVVGVCVIRVIWNLVAVPRWHILRTVMASYPITWCITSTAFLVYYLYYKRHHLQDLPSQKGETQAEE